MSTDGLRGRVVALLGGACMAASLAPLAVAADVPAPAAADAPPTPEFLGDVITESRVLYPLLVEGWIAESEQRYPEQRLGVSVHYVDNRKGRWIDVFFYPSGVQSPQALALVAGSERDGIAGTAREAGRAVELGVLEPFTLAQAGAATPGRAARLAARPGVSGRPAGLGDAAVRARPVPGQGARQCGAAAGDGRIAAGGA
ncbi:hypothetical protein H1235_04640 [Pseudoxanthomonas sp. NC8]|nr:hypothetical protein H1235_04640 [Pseudoxanthomonas sp. NC8]